MPETFYNISGVKLSPWEINIFGQMLDNTDHTYTFGERESELTRECLHSLVLEGLIERFQDRNDHWIDVWVISDAAIAWLADPEVRADIELAKAATTLVGEA